MTVAFWVSYAILWIMVAVLTVGVFALYHHFGQMYLGSPAGRQEQGPKAGSFFKPVESEDIGGATVIVPLRNKPMLVAFTSTSCPLCAQLRGSLQEFAQANRDVAVVVYCDGSTRAVEAWAGDLPKDVFVIADRRGRVAVRNDVDATPFGIAVGNDGIVRAKGIVNDLDSLENLAEQARSLPVLEHAN
jgi:thiol-disulfide isomerase/thioredoxin